MADLKNAARSSARTAVESTAAKPARQPSPREESSNTTQDQAAPAAPVVADIPLIVICDNPKRAGSIAHGFFALYGPRDTLTTVQAVRKSDVRGKDVSWDSDSTRRHILIGDDAVKFAACETREAKADFLRSIGMKDEVLIKRGYMDKPAPAPEVAVEVKEPVTA